MPLLLLLLGSVAVAVAVAVTIIADISFIGLYKVLQGLLILIRLR